MKKRLILSMAALAAVTLTSCQKDQVINQVPQEQAIEFNTYLGRDAQTKGTVINTEILGTRGFGVFAYYTGQSTIDPPNITAPNFMNNQMVKYESDSWKYSPLKYWPNTSGDKVSFYAYAPYDNDYLAATNVDKLSTQLNSTFHLPEVVYNVDADITKHIDVLFAPAQINQTKPAQAGPMVLKFYHALSRIGFKVKSATQYTDATITLTKVTLSGEFFDGGTLSLANSTVTLDNNQNPSLVSTNPSWTNGTKTQVSFTKNVSQSVTTSPSAVGNSEEYIMILPQEFSNSMATPQQHITLTVDYNVTSGDVTIPNTVKKSVNFTFEAGKAYTFIITIGGLQAVEFSAAVEDWQVQSDNEFSFN